MPINLELITKLFFFSFTLWLGAYALALAIELLTNQLLTAILLLPAILWIDAMLHLLPKEIPSRENLIRIWILTALPQHYDSAQQKRTLEATLALLAKMPISNL